MRRGQINQESATGFSLLEVLIAVLVLSFGLLGLAVLQLKMLQSAHSGYQRTLASVIAADATERLWIARAGVAGTDEVNTGSVQEQWLQSWSNGVGGGLSLPQLAGASTISADPNNDGGYTIVIEWEDTRFDSPSATRFEYHTEIF